MVWCFMSCITNFSLFVVNQIDKYIGNYLILINLDCVLHLSIPYTEAIIRLLIICLNFKSPDLNAYLIFFIFFVEIKPCCYFSFNSIEYRIIGWKNFQNVFYLSLRQTLALFDWLDSFLDLSPQQHTSNIWCSQFWIKLMDVFLLFVFCFSLWSIEIDPS